jgi:hypothetical protein
MVIRSHITTQPGEPPTLVEAAILRLMSLGLPGHVITAGPERAEPEAAREPEPALAAA